MADSPSKTVAPPRLKRALGLWDLVLYGIILVQPTAPMPLFGVVYDKAHGHVVTTVLIAMVAMLFTALSYGRMARAYPSAGSAFTYVGRELHPGLGFITGWSMAMDYMINPVICVIWCSQAVVNDRLLAGVLPRLPVSVWVLFFGIVFTALNLRGIKATARTNKILAGAMISVVAIFFVAAIKYLLGHGPAVASYTQPFYDPKTFSFPLVFTGTSLAALTYMGFDGISTLSEEVHDPRRNILRATVLTCLITGLLASLEVYMAQLVWPQGRAFENLETAYPAVAGFISGPWLFSLVNLTLLVASFGSGMGAQLAAARLLYGMGRGNAIPKSFFGAIEAKRGIPRNNVLFTGVLVLAGGLVMTYDFGAQMVNFGAFIGFMGVNAAAIARYYFREPGKRNFWSDFLPPALGFAICLFIWLNLETPAKLWGGTWMVIGLAYLAARLFWYKTRTGSTKQAYIDFDVPED